METKYAYDCLDFILLYKNSNLKAFWFCINKINIFIAKYKMLNI